jgi:hypothetical protein
MRKQPELELRAEQFFGREDGSGPYPDAPRSERTGANEQYHHVLALVPPTVTEELSPDRAAVRSDDRDDAAADHTVLDAYRHALAKAETEIATLTEALQSNRTIGIAIGILVERYDISPDVAFAYLRRISQDHNRKVRELAIELVSTGKLPDDGHR